MKYNQHRKVVGNRPCLRSDLFMVSEGLQCGNCLELIEDNREQPHSIRRYAMVRGNNISADKVSAYLPSNYRVDGTATATEPWGDEYPVVVISGVDDHGWNLDRYVIPRLGSGLMAATEIDLSHPVMLQLEV